MAGSRGRGAVHLPSTVWEDYVALSRYNSPYTAHDDGRAIDCYPADGAPSPIAGEVVAHRRVRAPDRPWAERHDHLLVVDTGRYLARVLHVDPAVAVGDRVDVGDHLGRTVRSGYFARWVDDHLHLGLRPQDADPVRATGSWSLTLDVDVVAVPWDGSGTVVEAGETHVVLDTPEHPDPGGRFAGMAVAGPGVGAEASSGVVLDGGLPHYDGAGLVGPDDAVSEDGPVSMLGTVVGDVRDGRVTWRDVTVRANGRPVTGLSLAIRRDRLGAKLVDRTGPPAELGEHVDVTVEPVDGP